MPSLKRLYAAVENIVMDLLIGGRFLTKKTPPKINAQQASVPTDWYFLKQVFHNFSFGRGDTILDVGCGSGRAVLFLGRRFPDADVYGIEFNQSVAEFAKSIVGEKHDIVEGDVLLKCRPETNVFYLFNPFHAEIMAAFCEQILNTRRSYIVVYTVPSYLDVMVKTCTGNVNVEVHNVNSPLRGLDRSFAVIKKI
jgi:SAM-dependent methyltransferase